MLEFPLLFLSLSFSLWLLLGIAFECLGCLGNSSGTETLLSWGGGGAVT